MQRQQERLERHRVEKERQREGRGDRDRDRHRDRDRRRDREGRSGRDHNHRPQHMAIYQLQRSGQQSHMQPPLQPQQMRPSSGKDHSRIPQPMVVSQSQPVSQPVPQVAASPQVQQAAGLVRFARANHWAEDTWASLLSALLTGRALDVYSRLSDDDAQDYVKVKEAILKRYELTEDGFKKKFRSEVPQEGEVPDQYIVRLSSYLNRWIELSSTPKTYEGICDLVVQEQFLDLCPLDLSIHLRERKPKSLEEMGRMSDQYLTAHETSLAEGVRPRNSSRSEGEPGRKSGQGGSGEPGGGFRKTCYHCRETGHVKADCPSLGKGFSKKNVVAQSMFAQGADKPWDADGNLAEDSKYSSTGAVNGQQVQVYRDTGSSRTFVNKTLVPRKAYTEDAIKVRLANGAVDSVPTARVELEVD
ncbi:PREDICTED: uncharacterized protein LOC109476860, partial [Branchiostoma belcheri]|uniref:Uncharacterized protein LOC109476860 n=1 Tax=Branchiostoma belcheri TaxID=7741 RepID=A0A6P4ZV07_BRABE